MTVRTTKTLRQKGINTKKVIRAIRTIRQLKQARQQQNSIIKEIKYRTKQHIEYNNI